MKEIVFKDKNEMKDFRPLALMIFPVQLPILADGLITEDKILVLKQYEKLINLYLGKISSDEHGDLSAPIKENKLFGDARYRDEK